MPSTNTARRIIAATIALAVAAVGCGSDDDATGADPTTTSAAPAPAETPSTPPTAAPVTPAADPTTTAATTVPLTTDPGPATTVATTAAPATTPAATDPPVTPAPATGAPPDGSHDPGCIQGAWVADAPSILQWYSGFMAGVAEIETVIGEMLLSFDAETFIVSTASVQFVLRVEDISTVGKLEGQSAGRYVATADGVMSTFVEINDFRMSATVAGVEVDMTSGGLPLDEMIAFTTFECADGTLTLETAAGGAQPSAFLVLHAA